MVHSVNVIKRAGKRPSEAFSRDKLHQSIFATCVSIQRHDGLAEDLAQSVCDTVVTWCATRPEVTSADIRRQAAKALQRLHPDAAYIYEHHKRIM